MIWGPFADRLVKGLDLVEPARARHRLAVAVDGIISDGMTGDATTTDAQRCNRYIVPPYSPRLRDASSRRLQILRLTMNTSNAPMPPGYD